MTQPTIAARSKLLARREKLSRLRVQNETDGQALREASESRERTSGEEIAEVLVALSEQERNEVQAIDAAIDRIDLGTWGQCTQCGEKIGAKRLKALPEATACLTCATAQR